MKPAWVERAEKDIGMREIKGLKHNQKILLMFRKVGHGWVTNDETPWCAAAVGTWLEEVGIKSTRKLNARSYHDPNPKTKEIWGMPLVKPAVGAIVTFWRKTKHGSYGHVAIIVGQDSKGNLVVVGANQNDMVCYARYLPINHPDSRVLSYRYPKGVGSPDYKLPIFSDNQINSITSEA
jgi:uncharacterized protein (TIGR02594 family)